MTCSGATATGGILAVEPSDGPVLGVSQDLMDALTGLLAIDRGLLDALSGCCNQLGTNIFIRATS